MDNQELISPHAVYNVLGIANASCLLSYRSLFNEFIPKADIDDIRTATNKAWVLGNDRFKAQIEQLMDRQAQPKPRGGDRRSELFKS